MDDRRQTMDHGRWTRRRTRDDGRQTVTHRLSSIVHRPPFAVRRPPSPQRPGRTRRRASRAGAGETFGDRPVEGNRRDGREAASLERDPRPLAFLFRDPHAQPAEDALARLVHDFRMRGVAREGAARALVFPRLGRVLRPVPPKPAGVPRQAVALNASPRFADGFGIGEPGGDLVERRAPPSRVERGRLRRACRRERSRGRARRVPNRTASPSARAASSLADDRARRAGTGRSRAPPAVRPRPRAPPRPARRRTRLRRRLRRGSSPASAGPPRCRARRRSGRSFLKNSVSARRGGAAINRPASRANVAPSRSNVTRTASPPVMARSLTSFALNSSLMPSASAASTHSLKQDMRSRVVSQTSVTRRAPSRSAVCAAATASSPAPNTTTDSGMAGGRPSATRARNASAWPPVVRAERQEHGVVLAAQSLEIEVFSQSPVHRNSAPRSRMTATSASQRALRQAELGNRVPQHPARLRVRVEDRAGMSFPQKIERRRKPRRSGADDGDFLAGRRFLRREPSAVPACARFRSSAARRAQASAGNRLSAQMAMGSSSSPRRQTRSQNRGQMRRARRRTESARG